MHAQAAPGCTVSCRSLLEERLQRGARAQPLALLLERRAQHAEPLAVRFTLQHRLEALARGIRVHRLQLFAEARLYRADLLEQRRRQVLEPHLAARVDDAVAQLVLLQIRGHPCLNLALHLLPYDRCALLHKLLPQKYRPPQAFVVSARAPCEAQPSLDGLGEAWLLVELLLRAHELEENAVQHSLRFRGLAVVDVCHRRHLRLEVRLTCTCSARVEHALQPHAIDDRVLPDVLHAVLRLLRHLLELIQVEDDAHLREPPRLAVDVDHAEAPRAIHQDVVIHLAVARLEDIEDGLGIRQVRHAQREDGHHRHVRCATGLLIGRLEVEGREPTHRELRLSVVHLHEQSGARRPAHGAATRK
mmetsp:Transcript_53432/g.122802  ORF Transcript_53432/g.122802 Transcript_53432/m.122802 type:complete len:360 (+) Transcript_53432:423-1502(+)